MKKIVLFPFALLLSFFAMAQTPVAWYPFTGNANDAVGSLNGTVSGATLTTDRFGNANSAYSFDGVDDNIIFNQPWTTAIDNFTATAWLKRTGGGVSAVCNGQNAFGVGGPDNGYAIKCGTAINFDLCGIGGPTSPPNSITTGIWHFVTVVRENGLCKIYINGMLQPNTSTNAPNIPAVRALIGSLNLSVDFFGGSIDEVKIYNTALTAAQVQNEFVTNNVVQKPGSGNAISFDGGNDFVVAPHSSNIDFFLNDNFSIDFWLKIPIALQTNTEGPDNMIVEKWEDGSPFIPYPFIFRYYNHHSPDNGQIRFGRYNGSSGSSVISAVTLNDNKWHHITGVKNGTLLLFYVDGMLTNTASDITTGSTNNNHNLYFGSRGGAGYFLNGSLDEVRIWNTALTQSQIRDRMCHKITSADALYSNLVSYYNFDENTGATAFDGTINANNGTLSNSPARVTSGAAIGNASSHDYVNAIKTTSIIHPTGESFTVTSTSGSPNGIQVYRVDEQPNTLNGAIGVGANDKYFGVFQVNGTSPQYTAVYNYSGNPYVTPGIESQLRLNKRSDNTGTSWTTMAAIPNEPANTITITGESTEYILGTLGFPLPLNLISFTGSKQNNDALLQWKTTNETGVSRFEVQRSNDGQTFTSIGTVSAGGSVYSFTDVNPFSSRMLAFYRLKSIDVDGKFTYSNIIKISKQITTVLTVYPNPVGDVLTISGLKQNGTIFLYSYEGKLLQQQAVSTQTITMDMSRYAKGIYLLQYKTEEDVMNQKILKQ